MSEEQRIAVRSGLLLEFLWTIFILQLQCEPCVLEDNYTRAMLAIQYVCFDIRIRSLQLINYERAVNSLHMCRYVLKH
jgi:hypothetical protein